MRPAPRLAKRALFGAAGLLAAFGLAGAVACGTEPVGVDTCRKIERVRCESAGACGIDLSKPVHNGDTPSKDVGACIRYYDDACLHGLVAPEDPGSVRAQECVDAIINGDCEIVKSPEKFPACSFLNPPAPAPAPTTPPADAGDG